jgi:hypothetical protein
MIAQIDAQVGGEIYIYLQFLCENGAAPPSTRFEPSEN